MVLFNSTVELSATSTETVLIPVKAEKDWEAIDLSVLPVAAATVAYTDIQQGLQWAPEDADWVTQGWSVLPRGRYEAEVLVGPARRRVAGGPTGTSRTPVNHWLWLEIRAGDEVVRRPVCTLRITR
jgi:hypothetical protein